MKRKRKHYKIIKDLDEHSLYFQGKFVKKLGEGFFMEFAKTCADESNKLRNEVLRLATRGQTSSVATSAVFDFNNWK